MIRMDRGSGLNIVVTSFREFLFSLLKTGKSTGVLVLISFIVIANYRESSAHGMEVPLDSMAKNYRILFEKNNREGHFEEALKYWRLYDLMRDSLEQLSRLDDLKMLDRKYQNDTRAEQVLLQMKEKELREIKVRHLTYSLFGITGLLIIVLMMILLIQVRLRLQANQQTMKVEQYLLRSQMNPHFIFNTLTNIQGLIIQQDKEASLKYLSLFSELTTRIQENSGMELVDLANELTIIRDYLQLQQMRYHEIFDYFVTDFTPEGFRPIKIPPMLLQPFVENAIEHGLKNKNEKGFLSVRIYQNERPDLVIEIEDNGVGREKSMEIIKKHERDHQGLATIITKERLDRMNRRRRKKIMLEITDLKNSSGDPTGTLVRFCFSQYS